MTDEQSDFVRRYGGGTPARRGEKGDKGERGKPGPRLPPGVARALVLLFVLNLLLLAAVFFGLIHYVRAGDADRCTTLEEVVAIPVPRPVAHNPSREWESKFEAIEAKRGRQLGCR